MKDSHRPDPHRSRVKTQEKKILIFASVAIALLAVISFFIRHKAHYIIDFYNKYTFSASTRHSTITAKMPEGIANTFEPQQKSAGHPSPFGDPNVSPAVHGVSAPSVSEQQKSSPQQNQGDIKNDQTPILSKSSEIQVKGDPYQQLVDELNTFYSHLDQQPYVKDFHLPESTKNHFSKLLQVLINNPPVITRETDDYFTLLKNTAHFFRVLGKDNIFFLKGILDREKDSFERILKIFYSLTDHPEFLKREYSLTIPKDNLYDYAGFFLNTIGGRLYLFRRDSASRMTVSFYAVLIIDKANRQGYSRLGIDLRPAIDSLIEEMENAGNKLKLKEEYLDTLFDLKEFYGNRG